MSNLCLDLLHKSIKHPEDMTSKEKEKLDCEQKRARDFMECIQNENPSLYNLIAKCSTNNLRDQEEQKQHEERINRDKMYMAGELANQARQRLYAQDQQRIDYNHQTFLERIKPITPFVAPFDHGL